MKHAPILLVLGSFLVLSFVYFTAHSPIEEDAFISFRYVQNLLNDGGLSFNPGDREPAYSNLSWIFILALPTWMGISLPASSFVLSWASGLVLLFYISRRIHPLPALLLATSVPFLHWSQHGLETVFYAMLVTVATIEGCRASSRSLWISGFLWGLAVLTRPEAPLLWAAFIFAQALILWRAGPGLKSRETWATLSKLAAPAIIAGIGLAAIRVFYHEQFLPNPYYAKPPARSFLMGINYILELVQRGWLWPLLPLPLFYILAKGRGSKFLFATAAVIGAQMFFILVEGGDQASKPHFRFHVPTLALIYIVAYWFLEKPIEAMASRKARLWAWGVLMLGLATTQVTLANQRFNAPQLRGQTFASLEFAWKKATKNQTNAKELRAFFSDPEYRPTNFHTFIAQWILDNIPEGSKIAYDQMGQTPFYVGFGHEFYDLFGLSKAEIAKVRYYQGDYNVPEYRELVFGAKPDYIMAYATGHLAALELLSLTGEKVTPSHPEAKNYELMEAFKLPSGKRIPVFRRK